MANRNRTGIETLNHGVDALLLTGLGTLYIFTLYPLLWWGDEPELMTAVWKNGVAHPTGYPVYLVLAKWFSLVPLGSVAWRGHFFSTFACLAGIYFLFRIVPWERSKILNGIGWRIGILCLALSPPLWEQSVVTEVYTLSLAFFGCVLLLSKRFREDPTLSGFLILSSVLGLSFGHHRLLGMMIPGLALWLAPVFAEKRERFRWVIPGFALFSAATVLPYGLLYWRAQQNPPLNWEDPSNLTNLWNLFSAAQFRADQTVVRIHEWAAYIRGRAIHPWKMSAQNFLYFPIFCWKNLGPVLSAVSLEGLVLLLIKKKRLFWSGFAGWLVPLFFIAQYHVADLTTFYLLPYVLVALAGAVAWGWTLEQLSRGKSFGIAAGLVAGITIMAFQIHSHRSPGEDLFEIPQRFARRILNTLPPNAVLLGLPAREGDPVDHVHFPLLYEHFVAGRNPGVALIATGFTTCPWYRGAFESQGLDTLLFDHLEGKTDLIEIREFDPAEFYAVSGRRSSEPHLENREKLLFYSMKGRLFGKGKETVGKLMAHALIPAVRNRPFYVTAPYKLVEPYLTEKVTWREILHIPIKTGGFPALDGEPLPSGKLYRAEFEPLRKKVRG